MGKRLPGQEDRAFRLFVGPALGRCRGAYTEAASEADLAVGAGLATRID
jgi:hypothetical protein